MCFTQYDRRQHYHKIGYNVCLSPSSGDETRQSFQHTASERFRDVPIFSEFQLLTFPIPNILLSQTHRHKALPLWITSFSITICCFLPYPNCCYAYVLICLRIPSGSLEYERAKIFKFNFIPKVLPTYRKNAIRNILWQVLLLIARTECKQSIGNCFELCVLCVSVSLNGMNVLYADWRSPFIEVTMSMIFVVVVAIFFSRYVIASKCAHTVALPIRRNSKRNYHRFGVCVSLYSYR